MGCVLGKRAARDGSGDNRPTPPGAPPRPGKQSSSVNLNATRKDTSGKRTDGAFDSTDSLSTEFRRENLAPYASTRYGWPSWLVAATGDVINDFTPRSANTFQKLDKIGKGTYSNVYKARDLITGKIVALKKVRFDNFEPESVKFMAREILVLLRLDHPNVIKLEGLVTSRMSSSLYLVFEYMEHDLAGLAASLADDAKFTEPQVKCYMKQLLSGLEHCHKNGVLHRDIKGSNLLIDNDGILKIADFGLATFYGHENKQPMTSRVITLWYRPPELLLGVTSYGAAIDIWSAGCILAELLAGRPILPGRTEVEQLHKIFKLCGSASDECWKKFHQSGAIVTNFKNLQSYRRSIPETFKDFSPSALALVDRLLSIDPDERGTASDALNSEFFTTEPYACEPSSLPKYPPSKEIDVKLREAAARRQRKASVADGARRVGARDRAGRAMPAPEANAEVQANLDRRRIMTQANAKSKSEKFPPPHQDGAVGLHIDNGPASFGPTDSTSSNVTLDPRPKSSRSLRSFSSTEEPSSRGMKRKTNRSTRQQLVSAKKLIHSLKSSSVGLSMDMFLFKGKKTESEVASSGQKRGRT